MNKIRFLLLPAALMALTGTAQAESIQGAMRQCGAVQNSLKRLVCYDEIVNNLERYSGLDDLMNIPAPLPAHGGSAAAAPQAQAAAQSPSVNNDRFGFEYKLAQQDTDERIFVKIAKAVKGRFDRFTITLDNGQVWKQSDSSARMKFKEGEQVYIEKGALGSFFLGKESLNKRMKVKRVK